MRHLSFSAALLSTFAWVGACSLINAPDDVVPRAAAGAAGKAGNSGSAGTTPVSNGGDGPTNPSGNDAGAGGAGSPDNGGSPAMGDAGATSDMGGAGGAAPEADPGPGPNPTTGMLVLGAQDAMNNRYLSVLNGRTGKEMASEPLQVAAVAYDEAAGRHVWFVFTASAFPAKPTGAADLEVRHFNEVTGKWFVIARATALPPPVPDHLVVLNDRLVYLSHQVVGGKAVSSLTVLDTSDLTNVKELTTRTAAAGETYVGVVGDRGSDVNADALGGRLRLMIQSDCMTMTSASDCNLAAQQVFVGASLTNGTSAQIDRFTGQPAFAKARLEERLYVALRSSKLSSMVVRSFLGADLASPTVIQFPTVMGSDVGGFVLDECDQAGAFSDVTGKQLIAFNLVSGLNQSAMLGYPGAALYEEVFGPSVLTLNSAAAPGLRAFELSKSGMMNVAVNERSVWQPTSKLMPLTGATRRGEMFRCP